MLKAGDTALGNILLPATTIQGNNLIAAVNAATSQIQAVRVSIADAGGYYTSTDVEGALQEIGAQLATIPPATNFQENEIPSGAIDGVNTIFTTAFSFIISSLKIYLNGLRQMPGITFDYTITGPNQFTFNAAPRSGSQLLVDYRV